MVRRPQTDVGCLCTDQLTEQPERSGLFPEAVAGAHWWCRQPTVESGVYDLRRLAFNLWRRRAARLPRTGGVALFGDAELVEDFHCHEGWSRLGEHWHCARPARTLTGHRACGGRSFSKTATWLWLAEVNGARSQLAQRSRTRKPVILAIRSSSDGHTYR